MDRVLTDSTERPSVDYSRTFGYELPTKIEFGMGISERVAGRVEECRGSMVLLVGLGDRRLR